MATPFFCGEDFDINVLKDIRDFKVVKDNRAFTTHNHSRIGRVYT